MNESRQIVVYLIRKNEMLDNNSSRILQKVQNKMFTIQYQR